MLRGSSRCVRGSDIARNITPMVLRKLAEAIFKRKHSRKLRLWSRKLCGSPRGTWGLRQAVLKGINDTAQMGWFNHQPEIFTTFFCQGQIPLHPELPLYRWVGRWPLALWKGLMVISHDYMTWEHWLVGGFKWFLFSSLLGEMIHFDRYFWNGLKPPTSWGLIWIDLMTSIFLLHVFTLRFIVPYLLYIYTLCCVYILEAYFLSWEMWWNIAAKAHGILAFNSRALKEYTWSTVQPGWGEASKGHEKPRFLEVVNRFTRSVRLDFLRWFIENLWISICIEDSKGNHFTISKNGGERTFHVHPPSAKTTSI